jgi:hypothetical protein
MTKEKGKKNLGRVKDIGPHGKGHCQPTEGSSKESTTADRYTGQIHGRIFRLEAEVHGTFRTGVNAPMADDAL